MPRTLSLCTTTAVLAVALWLGSCSTPVVPDSVPATGGWEPTLERVVRGVVVLRVTVPHAFDTERARITTGTGFVVDAERGLILTNRHLVQPGPVLAQATFLNHEEVDLRAVYRDPVHDFGFYRYDPSDLRFMDVEELPLAPGAARVGLQVRVVGNDAGDKLSILAGTLARLDRPAPRYSSNGYNDFNTFYLQAASSTSGGSSGSPVVDIDGRVVALNAGARRTSASSYYLPLGRVTRALDFIRQDQRVPRGTIETVFSFEAFDQLRRIGLRSETETAVRGAFPDRLGMLVVQEVVPGGPADGQLQPGDVLVRVNDDIVTGFTPLEDRLDGAVTDSVSDSLHLELERGGQPVEVTVSVADLHAITPAEYIEVGGAVVHPLSYQQARNHNHPAGVLYVAHPGYALSTAGIGSGALIRSVDGQEVSDLDDLWETLNSIAAGERVPVAYSDLGQPDRDQVAVVSIDRRWFPLRRCWRDDAEGRWPCLAAPPQRVTARFEPRRTGLVPSAPGVAGSLSRSLVMVDFELPYLIEGIDDSRRRGAGLVVDAERGLVVVDRDVTPVSMGDLSLTFGGSLRVPGRVVLIHPTHNLAVVAYDPDHVGSTPVTAASLSTAPLEPGDPVWQVGLDETHELVWRQTNVSRVVPFNPSPARRPLFRDHNIDVIDIESAVPTVGGALVDELGEVRALWASFPVENELQPELMGHPANPHFHGLRSELVEMVLEPLRRRRLPVIRTLGVELTQITSADARELGLSATWIERLEARDPRRPRVLVVAHVYAGFPSSERLRGGDLLLAINGTPITSYVEVDRLSQHELLHLDLLRGGAEIEAEVPTRALSSRGTDRVLSWAGAMLHEPHLEVAAQRGLDLEGVYVASVSAGSSARRDALAPTSLIVEVDGRPTPDLDTFLDAISNVPDGDSVRLRTINLDRQSRVRTVRNDSHYWPTVEFRLDSRGWRRIEHPPS